MRQFATTDRVDVDTWDEVAQVKHFLRFGAMKTVGRHRLAIYVGNPYLCLACANGTMLPLLSVPPW